MTVASSTAAAIPPAIVIPVIDYEPAIGAAGGAAAPALASPSPARPGRAPRLEALPPGPRPPSRHFAAAAAFADAALRTVLEVIDRRRRRRNCGR